MNDNNKIDDLVSMLDSFMAKGGGHVNVDSDGNINEKISPTIETLNTNECSNGRDMACGVPTLHEGLDGDE